MSGIRVPDAQYEAPTPEPEQAQVTAAKQPVANPTMFGTAQAEAGEQAGAKVSGAAIDFADRMIQMKQWNQQSQMYDDKESYRAFMEQKANDLSTHEVTDPKTGEVRNVPNGWNNITDQRDLGSVSGMVAQAQEEGRKLYGAQAGVTLLSVGKQYERYLGGIDSIYNDQATKHIVDQTKQNTVANFQSSYQKAMQATGTYNSFLDYHNNVNDISLWKNAGVSATNGVQLSAKEMQGMLKNNFAISGAKFYQDKIWSGKMTAEQANQDLDNSVSKMPADAVGDVDQIKKEITTQSDAYQTAVKKQGEQTMKDNTNKGVAMVGSGIINAKNVNALSTMGLDPKLVEPLTNAVQNVETQKGEDKPGFFGIGGSKKLDKAPITEQALGIDELDDNKEAKQAADYTIGIAKSMTHSEASDVLVKAITSGSLDKEQLNVYTRTLALVGQYLPTETEAAQGKSVDPKGVPQISSVSDLASWGIKANTPDLSHMTQHLDNLDNKIDPKESLDSVKKNTMNRMYPQTVGTGTTPSMVVGRDYSKRLFIGREADSSGYPFIYDEASKRAIPNKDYNKG